MNNKKKKKGSGWGILAVMIIIFLRAIGNGLDGDAVPAVIGLIVFVAVIAVIVAAVKKKSSAAKMAHDHSGTVMNSRPTPTVQTSRPIPSMKRREPVTAQREFSRPEAYCVSCELSGEDHFVRDRQRRIQQLDEWLKNGLVDREEYRVLKKRFENDQ